MLMSVIINMLIIIVYYHYYLFVYGNGAYNTEI